MIWTCKFCRSSIEGLDEMLVSERISIEKAHYDECPIVAELSDLAKEAALQHIKEDMNNYRALLGPMIRRTDETSRLYFMYDRQCTLAAKGRKCDDISIEAGLKQDGTLGARLHRASCYDCRKCNVPASRHLEEIMMILEGRP